MSRLDSRIFRPTINGRLDPTLFSLAFSILSMIAVSATIGVAPARASETRTPLETIIAENELWKKPAVQARITEYLKQHPDDPDVLCFLGRVASNQNQIARAKEAYLHALKVQPAYGRAMSGLSYCYITEKKFKEAEALARRCIALNQADPVFITPNETVFRNMEILYKRDGKPADVEVMQIKIDEQEKFQKARNLRERGVLDKAVNELSVLIATNPKFAPAYLLRGVIFNNRGDYVHAIRDFDSCIALQPELTTAYYLRGDAYNEAGNKVKALESWRRSLLCEAVPFPNLIAFEFTALTGRFREHFEPWDQNIVNKADIYYLCAMTAADLKRYAEAARDFTRCIEADKGEYKAYFERAKLADRLHLKTGLADLNQAIKLNPKYIDALLERAKLFERSHQDTLAMADYGNVIAINPADFGGYILRADLVYRLKNYKQSLADYNEAIKLMPSEDDPVIGRAKTYTALGRYDEAIADYRQAMKLNRQDRAIILEAIGKVEKLKKSAAPVAR